MNKLLSLLVLVVALSTAKAQEIPGYLGKKNVFMIGVSAAPAWWNFPKQRNNNSFLHFPEGKNSINSRINFAYERVVSQKNSLGAYASVFKNQFPAIIGSHGNTNYPYTYTGSTNHEANYFEAGIQLKIHSRSSAPLGRYVALKTGFVSSSFTVNLEDYKDPSDMPAGSGEFNGTNTGWRFSMNFGSNRIIKDKIIIDYGLELGMLLSPIKANAYIFTTPDDFTDPPLTKALNDLAIAGAATNGFLLINLNIGYVL